MGSLNGKTLTTNGSRSTEEYDIYCEICFEELLDETVFLPCGKHICKRCYDLSNKRKIDCPFCNGPFVMCENSDSSIKMEKLEKIIVFCGKCSTKMTFRNYKMTVCNRSIYKCKNKGCYIRLPNHSISNNNDYIQESHDRICPYKILECDNSKYECQYKTTREDIVDHMKECQYRPVVCEDCKDTFSTIKFKDHECGEKYFECQKCFLSQKNKEKARHIMECQMEELKCEFGCGEMIIRQDIEEHNEICPKALIYCEKKCDNVYVREQFDAHLRTCPNVEITCMSCGSMFLRGKFWEHLHKCPDVYCLCKYYFEDFKCFYQAKRKDISQHELLHSMSTTSITLPMTENKSENADKNENKNENYNENNVGNEKNENENKNKNEKKNESAPTSNITYISLTNTPATNTFSTNTTTNNTTSIETTTVPITEIKTDFDEKNKLVLQTQKLSYNIGTYWDIVDDEGHWYMGRILGYNPNNINNVLIHYAYWPNKFNQWIDLNSDRIAPLGSITRHLLFPERKVLIKVNDKHYVCTVKKIFGYTVTVCRILDNKFFNVKACKCKPLEYPYLYKVGDIIWSLEDGLKTIYRITAITPDNVGLRIIKKASDLHDMKHNIVKTYTDFFELGRY